MSALRLPLFLIAVACLVAGCAYDPQIAARYSNDDQAEAIVGPQLPLRSRPSAFDQHVEKKRLADPTTDPSVAKNKKKAQPEPVAPAKTASTKPGSTDAAPPANIYDDLTLPKPETATASSGITAPKPGETEVKVEEKIVSDTAAPKVETEPAPAAATPVIATTPETPAPAAPAKTAPAPAAPTPEAPATVVPEGEQVAVITTKFGVITIELDELAAPITVTNFKKLASEGYYNGTTFHRIIPDFMIQGGDPNSKGDDRAIHGKGGPDYTLQAEIRLKHKRGSVAMARLPNNVNPMKSSNGSQFYICIIDCPFLDGEYTVFGKVTSGMEVVDRISTQQRDGRDNPLQRIEMKVVLAPKPQITPAAIPAEAPAPASATPTRVVTPTAPVAPAADTSNDTKP